MGDVSFWEWFYLVAADACREENYLGVSVATAKACFRNDYTQAPSAKRCPVTAYQKRVSVTSKKTHKTNQFLPHDDPLRPFPRPQSTSPERASRTPGRTSTTKGVDVTHTIKNPYSRVCISFQSRGLLDLVRGRAEKVYWGKIGGKEERMDDVSFREWFYLVAADANMEENYLGVIVTLVNRFLCGISKQ
ncbi:hypothetical protein CEXT_589551 [Caerostris extrusa]|uniref:Uncharacterized protein n=1 Tax=Caerostris extrusa TaxID=172846 RepID=A0AAV4QCG1_CAEEX|nr:hypothetical protein CEXT_589551 [Caerostris extrusa]